MTDAIKAAYSDLKLVKTRGVVQIILEAPIEHADAIYALLGFPMPDREQWVGLALLRPDRTSDPESVADAYSNSPGAEPSPEPLGPGAVEPLRPGRHRWRQPVRYDHHSDRDCMKCGLIKRHRSDGGRDWTEWYQADGIRLPDGPTPPCTRQREA